MLRDVLRRSSLTIAIPLHGAAPWLDIISDNIAAAPKRSTIVVSDATLLDESISVLSGRHGRDRRVRFVEGSGHRGWRTHINAMIEASTTPLFTILPQDDSIERGHYEKLVDGLSRHPSAGLSFPRLIGLHENGDVTEHRPPPITLGLRQPWEEAIELRRTWNLGVPWRGVVRRRHLRPMLATPNDVWADLIWVFGIGVESHLVEVPEAVYRKRYHAGSTHGGWNPLDEDEVRRLQILEIDRRLGDRPADRAAALSVLAADSARSRPQA